MGNDFEFRSAVLGGTFDNFHLGHRSFIDEAFKKASSITIGITVDDFLENKKLSNLIEDFRTRKENVEKYLTEKGFLKRANIIPISDIYGNTLTEKDIDVIFVTSQTFENAKLINKRREEIAFPSLKIIEVDIKLGDDGKAISSTRIRSGQIDEYGSSFLKLFEDKKRLTLPSESRDDFKKPIGEVIKDIKDLETAISNSFVITVGDVATAFITSFGKVPDLSIFDLKTKREDISQTILSLLPKPDITLSNGPGTIESSIADTIHEFLMMTLDDQKSRSIKILGEEDLLTVPAILLAPINSKVIYGIRDVGAIVVTVTLLKKKEIIKLYLSKFK